MFVNVGSRTDIAHRYTTWLMNRLRAGTVLVRNPVIPSTIHRYQLTPDVVDCLVFCTKDPAPMLEHLDEVERLGFRSMFFVTITCYGPDIEPGVRDYHDVMRSFAQLSKRLGRSRVVWRYDPVLVTESYTIERHLNCFDEMASFLAPYTERCVFSFVEMYKKLAETFPELRAVTNDEKEVLLAGLSERARACGLRLQTCGEKKDYAAWGIEPSGCISVELVEHALGRSVKALRPRPMREGCGCLPSSDIGFYETCPNGCRYCYANSDHNLAMRNFRTHDEESPLLIGHIQPTDKIVEAKQRSVLEPYMQMGLF